MVIGLFIALGQVFLSSAYLGLVNESSGDFKKRVTSESGEIEWLRMQLYGSTEALPDPVICRWNKKGIAPSPECELQPLDVSIHVNNPGSYDPAEFVAFFLGSTRAIHLCKSCETDIVINELSEQRTANVRSLSAMGIYALTDSVNNSRVSSHFVEAKEVIEELKDASGTIFFQPVGVSHPINVSEATKTMILIINTALLIIVTLWLSLKGHRKVLDYFARNDALLPLVASCGKNTFYASLWIITLFRVAFFLLMVTPPTILVYAQTVSDETMSVFIGDKAEFILWLLAILASLSSLTIIASIAELKHRHSWVSFMYRYVPIMLCLVGTVVWAVTLVVPGEYVTLLRNGITAIPIFGISPLLLSPLISVNTTLLTAHSALASILVVIVLRLNSRWFAAHLEEI